MNTCVYNDVCPYLKYCITLNPSTCGVDWQDMARLRAMKRQNGVCRICGCILEADDYQFCPHCGSRLAT